MGQGLAGATTTTGWPAATTAGIGNTALGRTGGTTCGRTCCSTGSTATATGTAAVATIASVAGFYVKIGAMVYHVFFYLFVFVGLALSQSFGNGCGKVV
jgi:hypothetical protein